MKKEKNMAIIEIVLPNICNAQCLTPVKNTIKSVKNPITVITTKA